MFNLYQYAISRQKMHELTLLLWDKGIAVKQELKQHCALYLIIPIPHPLGLKRTLTVECDNSTDGFMEITDHRNFERYGYLESVQECANIVEWYVKNNTVLLDGNK